MQFPLSRPKKYNIMSTAIMPFRQFPCFTRYTDLPDFHSRLPVNRTFKGSRKKFELSAGRSKKTKIGKWDEERMQAIMHTSLQV